MKGGEIEVMKHFLFNTRTADECWASYLIAKRQQVSDRQPLNVVRLSAYAQKLGQDLRNPKNICPEDFMAARQHNPKIEAIHEKERAAEQRRWEIERREREQQRQLQRKERCGGFHRQQIQILRLGNHGRGNNRQGVGQHRRVLQRGQDAGHLRVLAVDTKTKADTLILIGKDWR